MTDIVRELSGDEPPVTRSPFKRMYAGTDLPVKSEPSNDLLSIGDPSGVGSADLLVRPPNWKSPRREEVLDGEEPPEPDELSPYACEEKSLMSNLPGAAGYASFPPLLSGEFDRLLSFSKLKSARDKRANAFLALRNPPPNLLILLSTWSSFSESVPEVSPPSPLACAGFSVPCGWPKCVIGGCSVWNPNDSAIAILMVVATGTKKPRRSVWKTKADGQK